MGKTDKLQGTLDLLILKTLQRGEKHGYGIVCHIQRVSKGVLEVEEGSLYPALYRLVAHGWIDSEWGVSENNRKARFYSLTRVGRRQLASETETWQRLSDGVADVLRARAGEI